MGFYRYFRQASTKVIICVFLATSLFASPAHSVDTKDSQLFIAGFNAYLTKDYPSAIDNLSGVLDKYPDTSLRDMAILWLSRAHFKAGHQKEAAQYMTQFLKEYPESPLKGTVEDELMELAAKTHLGENLAAKQTARTILPPAVLAPPDIIDTGKQVISTQDDLDRIARQKATAEKTEHERIATAKAETERLAAAKLALEKSESEQKMTVAAAKQSEPNRVQSNSLRDQAIAEYKTVVERYPGTPSAATATARLKNLAIDVIDYKTNADIAVIPKTLSDENTNVLSVEVGEQAKLEFTLAAEQQSAETGKRFAVPFEVVNRGNLPDSFILASGLPVDYQSRFVAAATPDLLLVKTPQLLPGERFNGLIQLVMPAMSIDGERNLFPVKVVSEADSSISQSRPLSLRAKAPILRTVIKSDLAQINPGDRIQYKLVLLNVGSAVAKDVTLSLTFPPQYEPVDSAAAGLKSEGDNALVLTGLQLTPGESRELAVAMQLKKSALAKEELFLHADLINTILKRTDKFVSSAATVKAVSGVKLQSIGEKITAVPGQTVAVSLAVTNTGNVRDDFIIKPLPAVNFKYSFYLDINRDGVRQPDEPGVSHIGPLAPKEVANLILEITTAAAEKDGITVPLTINLESHTDPLIKALASLSLVYSRPVLNLTVAGKGGKIKPGEVNSYELSCVNVGSSMARMVDVRSNLPEQLELIAAEPVVASKNSGEYSWRFDELGSGEKRIIKVSYRLKPGTAVGTPLSLKNILKYQDQLGNSY